MTQTSVLAGPVGPDGISVPGEPDRLRRAADGLEELCAELDRTVQQLREAIDGDDRPGRTVRALAGVARRTGRVLEEDARCLRELGEAVRGEADLLTEAQASVEQLRARWRRARQELRDALDGPGGRGRDDGPRHEAATVIDRVDGDVVRQHADTLRRLAGLTFVQPPSGAAIAAWDDGPTQQATQGYRREVSAVVEDLVESMRRVRRSDERLAELLPRTDRAVVAFQAVDTDAPATPEATGISHPAAIREVGQRVDSAAGAVRRAAEGLREIRLSIREGRMLPEAERIGSSDGFQRDWTAHFTDLVDDLDHARTAADGIAERLAEIDERGAVDVRRAARRD